MRTNRNARVLLVVVLVAVMPLGMLGGTAGAQDSTREGPPTMDLRWPGHSTQAGMQGSYCWSQGDGSGMCADMGGDSHKAMWVRSGARLKIRIHHADKPREFGLTTARRADAYGSQQGRVRELDVTLEPVVKDGETHAWDAFFRVGGERHHHLRVFGLWPQGDASWGFHVKTIRTAASS